MVWGTGTGLEHRGDAESGGFDPHDGRPGPGGARRPYLRPAPKDSLVPMRPRAARHPLLEAAIGASPPPKGLAGGVDRPFRRPGLSRARLCRRRSRLLCWADWRPCEETNARRSTSPTQRIWLQVDILGVQSGIQDQLSAAFGGVGLPRNRGVSQATAVPTADLGKKASSPPADLLVFLGRAHEPPRPFTARSSRMSGVRGQGCSRGCELPRSLVRVRFFARISTLSVRR